MRTLAQLVFPLATALWLGSAGAQPGGMGGMGSGMGLGPAPRAGCAQAADPAACAERRRASLEARQRAVAACKDVGGADRRRCIRDVRMAVQDCGQAADPARCERVRAAYDGCKAHPGPQMRACMRDALPAPDCAKAADPARCETLARARDACKDRPFGPERRQCLDAQAALGK